MMDISQIGKFVEVGYRALENREEIEYVAGRIQPYVDMVKADADLFPRITKLLAAIFPADPNAPRPTYDVKWVQRALNDCGAEPQLAVDGRYGEHTRDAVSVFQRRHDLLVDGWLGPMTMAVLHVLAGS